MAKYLTKNEKLELMFDLINAFSIANNPKDSTLLLQDLLTATEVKNLSIRLRIAKLLLKNKTQREISLTTGASLGTINKVNQWLRMGGEGFQKIVNKLPQKYDLKEIEKKSKRIPIEFQGPEVLLRLVEYTFIKNQDSKLQKFSDRISSKKLIDRKFHEAFSDLYKPKG